jgi:hypothetical protein
MARPTMEPGEPATYVFTCRVTEREKKALLRLAKRRQATLAQLGRQALLAQLEAEGLLPKPRKV